MTRSPLRLKNPRAKWKKLPACEVWRNSCVPRHGIHQAGKWFLHFGNPSKSVQVCFLQSQRIFFPTPNFRFGLIQVLGCGTGPRNKGRWWGTLSGRCWGDYIGWVLKRLKPQIWDPRWSYSNHRSIIWVDNLKRSNKHSNGQLTVYR